MFLDFKMNNSTMQENVNQCFDPCSFTFYSTLKAVEIIWIPHYLTTNSWQLDAIKGPQHGWSETTDSLADRHNVAWCCWPLSGLLKILVKWEYGAYHFSFRIWCCSSQLLLNVQCLFSGLKRLRAVHRGENSQHTPQC